MEENMNFGSDGLWLFALLILFGMGGFGGFGNRNQGVATQSDVVYTSAFNQLQDENTAIRSDIQRTAYETMGVVKDTAYNNLSELRDLQAQMSAGFANQAQCCCELKVEGMSNTQKILDAIAQNKIEALQARINSLELAQATAGVVKYPASTTYSVPSPCFGGCGCGAI